VKNFVTIGLFVLVAVLSVLFYKWVNTSAPYAFFVAGHVYGDANKKSQHIHPPFREAYDYIRAAAGMSFGVFTGDIVKKAQPPYFETFLEQAAALDVPYYIAPGNHDVANRELFESLFGDKQHDNRTYGAFTKAKDLFLLLDGNSDNYNIAGDQLAFLRETLDFFGPKSRNIFIFVHQLIWWDEENIFKNITTNWPPLTPDTNNYWSTVEPMLDSLQKPVYLFAGDLGGNQIADPFMYHRDGQITYIASGMGHGKDDNFIIVHVDNKGEVEIELVALQGEKDRLGDLEEYELP
jgi:hypothetical protein